MLESFCHALNLLFLRELAEVKPPCLGPISRSVTFETRFVTVVSCVISKETKVRVLRSGFNHFSLETRPSVIEGPTRTN